MPGVPKGRSIPILIGFPSKILLGHPARKTPFVFLGKGRKRRLCASGLHCLFVLTMLTFSKFKGKNYMFPFYMLLYKEKQTHSGHRDGNTVEDQLEMTWVKRLRLETEIYRIKV